ncbi:CAP domain-containing protein [Streptomyces sp. DH12]|uniref:CAP domain-containing protein n=1 Tax=Streptomyces sp. DH12 TaxID=2857010 RepID=UPI0027DED620|nr:CAP domain-containing protein [Streptomyces sp. DH12]
MRHHQDPTDQTGRPSGERRPRHHRARTTAAPPDRRLAPAARRRAGRRWTYQGVGTIVAGAVAVAAVAAGTLVLDGTGGAGGSLATRTAVPGPTARDHHTADHHTAERRTDGPAPRSSAPGAAPDTSPPAIPPAGPADPAPADPAASRTPGPPGGALGERRAALPAAEATHPARAPRAGTAWGTAARQVRRVVALTNAERAKAGCPALRVDRRLQKAAQKHADDMAARDYYQHESPEGRDAGDRIRAAGYRWHTWGENIHRGPRDPVRAVRDWMKSPAHRENILNCAFRDVGIGVNLRSNGPWWVQGFAVAK